ncbi:single-stranded DNA-binding protein [Arthrobacter globiformis]|uniref:single-stranded DNA-binding protein n=1 Tax=Arthrobacter globiformis TaxID=1665 RepID=UPI000B412BCF|nr:single-stranded DNA-binding protein [Arthrobacter globiformis]
MNGETSTTIIGNLTNDPELRTVRGAAVANFTIASTPRIFDTQAGEWKDGETLFLRASVWRGMAENAATSLAKGSRVVVTGRLKPRTYETKAGEKRSVIELEVDEIGLSLRHTAIPHGASKTSPKTGEKTGEQPGTDRTAEEAGASGPDTGTQAPVPAASHPADHFTLSPRLYANEDVWFGKYANPSGTITTGTPEEPAF